MKKQFDGPYDPLNKGVLFKNNKKTDESPDYIGSLNVAGDEWTVFGRLAKYEDKQTGETKTMMKLSVAVPRDANRKPVRAPANSAPQPKTQLTEDNWADDNIPF